MIIPIRCFSCGNPVGHLWEEYLERVKKGEDRKKVMDELGMERYCCRALFLACRPMTERARVTERPASIIEPRFLARLIFS